MPVAEINGLSVAYDLIGMGAPWVITPGGRFSMDAPGVRGLAEALAAGGKKVLIWDRPNTGASQVCFSGPSESEMQTDVAGRAPTTPGHDARGDRRGLGRIAGVVARPRPAIPMWQPGWRCGGSAGGLSG